MRHGVLDVSWSAPKTNVDGTLGPDATSYRVYYGTMKQPCPSGSLVRVGTRAARPDADQTVSVRLTGLTPGELYYVTVVAVNSDGVESVCSDTVSAPARPS
jgi:phosphodiesterase/alkaline phosphatase D-like protein